MLDLTCYGGHRGRKLSVVFSLSGWTWVEEVRKSHPLSCEAVCPVLCCFLLLHTLRLLPTLGLEGPKQGQELHHILSTCVAVIALLVLHILALMPVWKLKCLEKSPGDL